MTDYCTSAQIKTRLSIPSANTDSDAEITLAITGASRDIDHWCDRIGGIGFGQYTGSRYLGTDRIASRYHLAIGDTVSLSAVALDLDGSGDYATAWTSDQWQLEPRDAAIRSEAWPYTHLRALAGAYWPSYWPTIYPDPVKLTGVFGWPSVPANVNMACQILATESLKVNDAPFGVAGFGEFGVVRVRTNPMVQRLLSPYMSLPMKVG